MHDEDNRAQTIAALPVIITQLQAGLHVRPTVASTA